MVQLKFSQSILPQNMQYADFNSIVVQLKLENPKIAVEVLLFQFHSSTIKTTEKGISLFILQKFQFHSSTIKTSGLVQGKDMYCNFNSIMVQLKHV